ncbi:MAG: DNA mismatch repair endonuclease MutL [Ruminococcaceae bacterium]|nr:DNA mismatch repair endonuclease MutL [Oscillospiraceae bacterium]
MGKINVLSFAVANLIAAGEVVDRPSSVIKELLENAIDSGADKITVEIQNGGVTYMRVSDNGCGMTPEDLPVSIRRHATSKIKNAEDLDGIITLGFRGEALAAIASVSDIRIITKTRDASVGAMLEAHGGNIVGVQERACTDGTTVIVENLFSNVPARRKFLKKDVTEAMAVSAIVEKVALSRPDIAFKLIIDGNVKLETIGDKTLKSAVYSVFGREFASKLLEASIEIEGIKVHGYISRPDNVRANRNYQNFFINGRYVRSKTALAAIEQAYSSYIASEKFPCCVLFIEINPATVDVNVHPAKLEVKFSNEKPVFEAIYYAVRNTLESNTSRPDIMLGTRAGGARVSDRTTPIEDTRAESLKKRQLSAELYGAGAQSAPRTQRPQGGFAHITAEEYLRNYTTAPATKEEREALKPRQEQIIKLAEQKIREQEQRAKQKGAEEQAKAEPQKVESPKAEDVVAEPDKNKAPNVQITKIDLEPPKESAAQDKHTSYQAPRSLEYRIIGEAFNSYVIVERGDKLLLIDKHAAHERILFEQLKAALHSQTERASQILALPVEYMMTTIEMQMLRDYKEEIEAVGFEYVTGKYIVFVTAIPEGIDLDKAKDMLTEIADRLHKSTGDAEKTRADVFEKALYQASCKAAIKAGREYPPEYVEWIVDKLMQIPDITVCPHGRPVAMELSKKNLDYQFERS